MHACNFCKIIFAIELYLSLESYFSVSCTLPIRHKHFWKQVYSHFHVYMYMWAREPLPCVYRWHTREEGVESPGCRVAGCYEPSRMGVGIWTWVNPHMNTSWVTCAAHLVLFIQQRKGPSQINNNKNLNKGRNEETIPGNFKCQYLDVGYRTRLEVCGASPLSVIWEPILRLTLVLHLPVLLPLRLMDITNFGPMCSSLSAPSLCPSPQLWADSPCSTNPMSCLLKDEAGYPPIYHIICYPRHILHICP